MSSNSMSTDNHKRTRQGAEGGCSIQPPQSGKAIFSGNRQMFRAADSDKNEKKNLWYLSNEKLGFLLSSAKIRAFSLIMVG